MDAQVSLAGRGVASGVTPKGQAVTGVTPAALVEVVASLGTAAGILQVFSPHHCWHLVLVGEGILLAESGDRPLDPFLRKAKDVRPPLPRLAELERLATTADPDRLTVYRAIAEEDESESLRPILQQTLYEVLLAIALETEVSIRWFPNRAIGTLSLPRWRLATLYAGLLPEAQKWRRDLTYVRHPYQRVQLLDSDDTIAQVPLFASVTGGRHRIVEIADRFKQDVFRTALKLDKLAAKRTVAILPLSPSSQTPIPIPETEPTAPTVCVVDDSPLLLQQFAALLEQWGYESLVVRQPQARSPKW
ncbi:MAG: hypothetical protein HC918_09220 [Oscillatoriales cyanobacterium SM2_1_8]|nr:hypothetical protein [Oscillatoriales cyanobacterium SM2_1_8]